MSPNRMSRLTEAPKAITCSSTAIIIFLAAMSAVNLFGSLVLKMDLIFYVGVYKHRALVIIYLMLSLALMIIAQRFSPRTPSVLATRAAPIALIAALAISGLIIGRIILQSFANSSDEYAFLFQAQTYLAGRLWNPVPILGQALASDYTWVVQGKWVGQYPPAWPFVIALASRIGLAAWAINSILVALSAVAMGAMIRRFENQATMSLLILFFSAAPFTVFNAGSLHSHMLAATLTTFVICTTDRMLNEKSVAWAVATGILIGALGLTRYMTAAIVCFPLLITLLCGQHRVRLLLGVALGGVPFLAALLLYHYSITGDPLKPVYWLSGRTVDHLYFDWASILQGMDLTRDRLLELSLWTTPAILPLSGLALWIKARSGKLAFYDGIFPLSVLIFLFYPLDAGNRFGPRYYFDSWPALVISIATSLPYLTQSIRLYARSIIFFSALYGLALWPFLAIDYWQIVTERKDLYSQIVQRNIKEAVVFVRSGTGRRLLLTCDDLVRNDIDAAGSVLYARCDMTTPEILAASFPNRQIWIYDRDPKSIQGELIRFR